MTATELRLTGVLGAPGFLDWICHRARLLDLAGWVAQKDETELTIVVFGPEPLIDAMEMACSLGPVNVLVERVEVSPVAVAETPNGFSQR